METIELWHPHELALRHMPEDFFVHGPPMPAQSVLCRPVFVEVDDLEPRVITKLVKENLSNLEELIVARCDDAGSEASRKEWRSLVAALKNYSPNLHTLLWTGGLFSNARLSESSSLKKLDKLHSLQELTIGYIDEILPYIDVLPGRRTESTALDIIKPPASNFSLLKQFTLITQDELSLSHGKGLRGAADALLEAGVTMEAVKHPLRYEDIPERLVASVWIAPPIVEPDEA